MGRSILYSRPKTSPPETLLQFLTLRFTYLTSEAWETHLKAGYISVKGKNNNNNIITCGDYILCQHDEIHFNPPRELEPSVDEYIEIIYEDNDIIVCAKNGNIPVAEGGRYCNNTLVGVLQRRNSNKSNNTLEVITKETESILKNNNNNNNTVTKERKRQRNSKETNKLSSSNELNTYYPVHRLDKETSGLVVLAKQNNAAKLLSLQFTQQSERLTKKFTETIDNNNNNKRNETLTPKEFEELMLSEKVVTKSYIAVLAGVAPSDSVFVISDRIGLRSEGNNNNNNDYSKLKKLTMACYPANISNNNSQEQYGKPACSRVHILSSDISLNISIARVDILTGRTHQIRLHCAQLGFPVLGDKLYTTQTPGILSGAYAVPDKIYLERVRENINLIHKEVPRLRVRRHLLHAALLSFYHPITKERLLFFADPRDWLLRDVEEVKEESNNNNNNKEKYNALEALRELLDIAIKKLEIHDAYICYPKDIN